MHAAAAAAADAAIIRTDNTHCRDLTTSEAYVATLTATYEPFTSKPLIHITPPFH